MKVDVDTERCQGHGVCAGIAPDVFDLDPSGKAVVVGDENTPDLVEGSRAAMASCPELAISVEVEGGDR
ncbi:ferredoxin [Pseudonocardia ailaonensis]|uniref:Ferredoxin n=1 Tax=Pseudonocardia ailaonensis TaxID=367279 RepID=A0ABN2N8C8_9PSEU